ncbi:MAG: penicillin-binding protein 1A [Hyphomicrobium sp.]
MKKRRKKSLILSFLGWCFGLLVLVFLAGSSGVGYLLWQASKDLPDYKSLAEYEPPVMSRIHAHDGSLIAEYAREHRIFVPINSVPKRVLAAFLSAEDKRFYDHNGLDLKGISRALIKFIEAKLTGRGSIQGASTITQQVAKNFLLTSDRTFDRKIKEAILSIRIERTYSKNKILELYLNEIYLGIGAYGVAAAGLNYFNKELKDLTLEEVAYLAALPKAPNNYHPFKQHDKAIERRNWVLGEMAENGYITKEEAKIAQEQPLTVNFRQSGPRIFAAEYFSENVRRFIQDNYGEEKLYSGGLSVRTTLDPRLQEIAKLSLIDGLVKLDRERGWRGPVGKVDVSADWGVQLSEMDLLSDILPWRLGVVLSAEKAKAVVGLRPAREQDGSLSKKRDGVEISLAEVKWAKVPTTKVQPKAVTEILSPGDVIYVAPKDPRKLDGLWSLMQIPEVEGGLVVMDPHTGRILAIAGGFSFSKSQFDRVTQAKRQPGSSFKPFVYAAAVDNGYKPTSIILDEPIEIEQGPGLSIWKPENYEKENSYGPATLRFGVEKSRNQMTARLAQDLGLPTIVHYATKKFAIYDELLPLPSISLGASETTLLKMATAYCMLANGGKRVESTLIDRIQDRYGHAILKHDKRECTNCNSDSWENQIEPEIVDNREQIIDPYSAYQMTSILEGVIQRGTATVLKSLGRPIAGKTGTSNEEKDAWFIGYTPDLVVGVFVGFDTPRPMGKGRTGGGVAAPIFGDFFKRAFGDEPPLPFRVPPGIKLVTVNLKTGLRSTPEDPEAIVEAFKPNEDPDDAYSMIGFQVTSDESSQSISGGYPTPSSANTPAWTPPSPVPN